MSTLPPFSSVPGMAIPGRIQPGLAQYTSLTPYQYIGQAACFYLDYLDVTTGHTLSPVPGGYYTMTPVSGRQGLTVPPPGRPWNPGNAGAGGTFAPMAKHGHADAAASLARGRVHTAALHAAWASGTLRPGEPLSGNDHAQLGCCPPGQEEEAAG